MNLLFDDLINQLLCEFNVEDRNDPAFYDYVVVFLQQLLQRNLVKPGIDVRKTAMRIVKDGYYNFVEEDKKVSLKVSFLFDARDKTPNNLKVEIDNLVDNEQPPKVFANTHEESSIDEVVEYIDSQVREAETAKEPGTEVPAEVGETPSELPGAEQPQQGQEPNTSQYLKGL